MDLMHIKLKTGQDLISYVLENNSIAVTLKDPVQFGFDPDHGIFGIDWLLLSNTDTVIINHSDIYFVNATSSKGIEFYNQFSSKYTPKKEDHSYVSELETIFEAMLESKSNIKH